MRFPRAWLTRACFEMSWVALWASVSGVEARAWHPYSTSNIYSRSAGSYSNPKGSKKAARINSVSVQHSSQQLFFFHLGLVCMSMHVDGSVFVFICAWGLWQRECPPYNFLSLRISGEETPPSRSAVIFLPGVRFAFSEVVGLCQDSRCQGLLHVVAP